MSFLNKISLNKVALVVTLGFAAATVSTSALAASKPELVVSTYSSFQKYGPADDLKVEFEKVCNCTLTWKFMDKQNLIYNKFLIDRKNTVDVLFGIDTLTARSAEAKGEAKRLFVSNIYDTTKLDIPGKWEFKHFVPFDASPITILYNTDRVKNPPKTFREFVDSDITFIYADPRYHALGRYLTNMINHVYGANHAEEAWAKIKKKTITIGEGWSSSYGAFAKGESDSAMGYESSLIYHTLVEKNTKIQAMTFAEGNYVSYETMAISKKSKNIPLAKKFVNFVLTPEIQKIIAIKNSGVPVRKVDNAFINSLGKNKEIKSYPNDSVYREFLAAWEKVILK